MDTMFPNFYMENPYAGPRWSRQRKVVFSLDMAGRLTALDAKYFAEIIAALTSQARALSLANATTGSAVRQQAGDTRAVDAALQLVRDTISSKHGVLKDTYGKNSEILEDIFGEHLSTYTQGLNLTNYDERTGTLLQNMQTQHVDDTVIAAVQKAVDALITLRDTQTQKKSTTTVSYTAGSTADTALNTTLLAATGTVLVRYPSASDADKAARHAAYNFALLPAPHHGGGAVEEAGFVAGQALALVQDDVEPKPLLKVRLRNVGNVRLCFALSADLLLFPAKCLEVLPGATLSGTLADLGDPMTQHNLLVQNPTSELGQYEVVLG